jgi:hypothetical protein
MNESAAESIDVMIDNEKPYAMTEQLLYELLNPISLFHLFLR